MTARAKKRGPGRPDYQKRSDAPLARRLKAMRDVMGWTLSELEERCGVSLRSLSRYECGRLPGLVELSKIARAYGTTAGEILRAADRGA